MRIIYLILILFTYNAFSSDDVEINADDIWVLNVRSNKFFSCQWRGFISNATRCFAYFSWKRVW